jgi:3-keto-disaccharide hydrolase
MKRWTILAGIVLAAIAVCTRSLLAAPPETAKPAAGFTMALFEGGKLDPWRITGCDVTVEDGSLLLKAGNGFVRSHHRYGDFVLELDWKSLRKEMYDSGIYFRAELPQGKRPWPTRYQINLKQGDEGNVKLLPGAHSSGLVKPGEWNHFKLTVVGGRAELEINGRPAWKVDGIETRAGYIGLQAEVPLGGQFEFRDIRVTELGYRSLFDGRDLTGWEGAGDAADKCWKVEDGLLVCDGQRGPWLRSADQYGDFNLRLEYKLKPGGNSGVYLRVPKGGAHRGLELSGGPSGIEVQLLDDPDKRYASIKPYQSAGSLYALAAAKEHVARPAGEWNTLEINCRGTAYRVTHNGVVVVDATEKDFPELARRELRGYLGLQNHSEHVWFRNLRVGPAEE